jgi:AraC family transcriptional regulator
MDGGGEHWLHPGFFITPHTHPVWEFHLQVTGSLTWESRGRRYELEPGMMHVVPPNTLHALPKPSTGGQHFYWAGINLEKVLQRYPALRPAWRGRARQGYTVVHNAWSMEGPFRALTREMLLGQDFRAEGLRAAVDHLVIEASRLWGKSGGSFLRLDPIVEKAKLILDDSPGQPWRLEDLAGLTGTSRAHLARSFARAVGISPHQYLLRRRIELAKEMLLDPASRSVTDLALELGFSSSQHFARVFRRLAGCTAQEFRARASAPVISCNREGAMNSK